MFLKKFTCVLLAALPLAAQGQAPTPPAPGIVKAEPGNPYQRAAQLAPRIMDFKATPASIQPGQQVNLVWLTENPTAVTIEPGIGKVTARGNRLSKDGFRPLELLLVIPHEQPDDHVGVKRLHDLLPPPRWPSPCRPASQDRRQRGG